MEGGSLFNPGFLGGSFLWWIGQIASDSTWRDNMLPGKFESKDQIPGWGRRYKVRIIGLHDQGETEIPSDQLPWAQIMYPVTAGGGQAHASSTSNLRQGMMVFGFFLDGQDQQVPVIMGVLGNNAQTPLATTIGDNRVTNTQSGNLGVSGHANPADGNKDPNLRAPDEGLVINKPKSQEQSQECAPPPPGTSVNQFGLRSDLPLTKIQFRDQQNATAEADARGLTGTERAQFIQKAVSDGIKSRCEEANSPNSPSQPGATRENADAVHEQSKADIVRNDYYNEKTVVMSPCNKVQSALKAIQIEIDNLVKKIDKVLNAANSYVDAVSNVIGSPTTAIDELIAEFACAVAKYMKIVFDKIMEYCIKKVNCALAPTIEIVPPNMRYMYFDVKEKIVEIVKCLYSKITNSLCSLIQGFLQDQIRRQIPPESPRVPITEICSVEELTGNVIALNMNEIDAGISDMLENVNNFLKDIQSVLGTVSSTTDLIGDVTGSITSALSFENLSLNVLGCDLKPNCAATDYYTLQSGGSASEDAQLPRVSQVDKTAQSPTNSAKPTIDKPFAQPSQNETDYVPPK